MENFSKLFYLSELYDQSTFNLVFNLFLIFEVSIHEKVEFSNRNNSTLISQGIIFKMHIHIDEAYLNISEIYSPDALAQFEFFMNKQ